VQNSSPGHISQAATLRSAAASNREAGTGRATAFPYEMLVGKGHAADLNAAQQTFENRVTVFLPNL